MRFSICIHSALPRSMFRIVLLLILACASTALLADGLRCGSRVIVQGDSQYVVEQKCGAPDFIDSWRVPAPFNFGFVALVEDWYYNFGPSRLIQVLRFRNQRLVDIETDGYGFSQPELAPCQPQDIVPGISKFQLLTRCGEPESAQSSTQFVDPALVDFPLDSNVLHKEEWLYDFGASRLLRIVTLINGRVVFVDTDEERGFGR